jgi:hypothetical protein
MKISHLLAYAFVCAGASIVSAAPPPSDSASAAISGHVEPRCQRNDLR